MLFSKIKTDNKSILKEMYLEENANGQTLWSSFL